MEKNTRVKYDLSEAENILNEDHFGLDKVKDRIIEYWLFKVELGS